MVNEQNLINLINNKKPVELVQELEKYEIKKSPLSMAARAKIIKRNGGGYQSSRMSSEDIALMQRYGPGFWDDFVKPVASGVLVAASLFPPTAAIAVPVAIGVGATGAGLVGLGHVTDSDGLKEFGKDIVEIAVNSKDGLDATNESRLNSLARHNYLRK